MQRRPVLFVTLIIFCALASVVAGEAYLRHRSLERAKVLAQSIEEILNSSRGPIDSHLQELVRVSGFDAAELWQGARRDGTYGVPGSKFYGPPFQHELTFVVRASTYRLLLQEYSLRWWILGLWLFLFALLVWAVSWIQRQSQLLLELKEDHLRNEKSGHAVTSETLRQRLKSQEMLQGLMDHLRQTPTGQCDQALNVCLETLGLHVGADRAFIFLDQDQGRRFGYTHGWAAPGLRDGAMDGMVNLPTATFSWWNTQLRVQGVLHYSSLSNFPAEASAERYLLSLSQLKSFLVVPLKIGGEYLGFCGFSRVRFEAPFKPFDEDLLNTMAGSMAALLVRSRMDVRSQRLSSLEALLAGTARSFVVAETSQWENALSQALDKVGTFCAADRAALALTQNDGLRLVFLSHWQRPGCPEGPKAGPSLAAAGLPNLMNGLQTQGLWQCESVEGLGLQEEPERVEWTRRGAKAVLVVALRQGSHLQGCLILERVSAGQLSDDAPVAASAVADIVASVLRRQQAEAGLRASEERARALLAGVPDALLRFSKQGRILDARLPKGDRFFVGELYGKDIDALPSHVPGLSQKIVPALRAAFATSLRTGQAQALDLRLGDDASVARYMEARFVPQAEDEVLLLLRDRTLERRRDYDHERQLGNLLAIFNAGSRGMALLGRDGRLQAFNQVALERVKTELGITLQMGNRVADLLHPSMLPVFRDLIAKTLNGEEPDTEIDYPLPKGGTGRLKAHFLPVFGEDGEVRAICVSLEYLERLKQAEEALAESEERYILAAQGANDGLWDLDLRRHSLYVSSRWEAQAGLAEGQGPHNLDEWLRHVHVEDSKALNERLQAHLEGRTDHFEAEYRLRHHENGDYRWVLSRGLAVRNQKGQAIRVAGSQTDIQLAKAREGSLLKDALQDPLTGLPNRALVLDRLGRCLARAKRRKGYAFALLFLDTDNFKTVNQSMGHAAGESLIKELAARLETALRPGDTVGRLGGDEFAVLLDDLSKKEDATFVAQRILDDCQRPFIISGREVYASVSVGIALSQAENQSPLEILRDAETAMVQSKAMGRSKLTIFDSSMHEAAVQRLDLETGLRQALSGSQFRLYYQPIVKLSDGHLLGFEALARWMHPEKGLILPGEFIPAAEESGLILPLGRLVLKQSLETLADWGKEGRGLKMSVNLSPRQLEDPELLAALDQALQSTGIQPQRLQFEITESVLMNSRQGATRALEALRARGVTIAIDDFGTGYSSLSYLHQFPVETLKIDRAFVSRMDGSSANEAVTSAIVALGRNLGLELVAEGIETEMQARRLQILGCQAGQGYWFAKPMPENEARTMLGKVFLVPAIS